MDLQILLADAESSKGTKKGSGADLHVAAVDNVEFLKAKYYSRQQRQTYLAPVPPGWKAASGCGLDVPPGHHSRPKGVTCGSQKLAEWFNNMEMHFSGEISKPYWSLLESSTRRRPISGDAGSRSSPWQNLMPPARVDGRISIAMWCATRCIFCIYHHAASRTGSRCCRCCGTCASRCTG